MAKKKKNQSTMSLKERQQQDLSLFLRNLDAFQEVLSYGFSDENFARAAFLYKKMQDRLFQTEREALGSLWRDVYTDSNTLDAVCRQIDAIKARFPSATPTEG